MGMKEGGFGRQENQGRSFVDEVKRVRIKLEVGGMEGREILKEEFGYSIGIYEEGKLIVVSDDFKVLSLDI